MVIKISFKNKIIACVIGVALIGGSVFAKFYQPPAKTDAIYLQALEDEKNEDFANAYYLFSRVTPLSNLKPVAIYHQAQCAMKLEDKKTALKNFKALFEEYPSHKLALKAKYLYAAEITETNPSAAKKYFEEIIQKHPDNDCATAAEYFLGLLITNKYKLSDKLEKMPVSAKTEAETYFRHYLTKAPSGRWAMSAVRNWLAMNSGAETEIPADDKLLMAKVYYLFGDYENADKMLQNLTLQESWALNVKNLYALKDFLKVKILIETGMKNYAKYADEQDVYDIIDLYLGISASKTAAINHLLSLAEGSSDKPGGADYLLYLKCGTVSAAEKEACYTQFYGKYPNGKFSAEVLSNLFFEKIRKKNYDSARKIGKDYLLKFPRSNSSPFVLFWLGKMAQRADDYKTYNYYYSMILSKYPDNYYAYRSYINLHHLDSPLISKKLKENPVEFPYKQKDAMLLKLAELHDYEIITELTDDDFIKSWVSFKKRDFTKSTMEARKAMEKLQEKPDKHDLRWRLVYPLVYYETTKKYAGDNNAPLMQSILREESYFDPLAQSATGARGLMQLMPATAGEVGKRHGAPILTPDDLFHPATNVKLGNYYYLFLKNSLGGSDISSVAAYNGGIGSLQKWKSSLNYEDTDEFVEQIPFPETQNYVKKVFRSYWNYVRIYGE